MIPRMIPRVIPLAINHRECFGLGGLREMPRAIGRHIISFTRSWEGTLIIKAIAHTFPRPRPPRGPRSPPKKGASARRSGVDDPPGSNITMDDNLLMITIDDIRLLVNH